MQSVWPPSMMLHPSSYSRFDEFVLFLEFCESSIVRNERAHFVVEPVPRFFGTEFPDMGGNVDFTLALEVVKVGSAVDISQFFSNLFVYLPVDVCRANVGVFGNPVAGYRSAGM